MEETLFEKGQKELAIKKECVKYAQKIQMRKRLSNFHLVKLVTEKFKTSLNEVDVKIDVKTMKFKDA